MCIPDVLGFKLEDAVSLLSQSGYNVSEIVTRPSRGNPDGPKRVVRLQSKDSDHLVLTVTCEEKGKGGVLNGL